MSDERSERRPEQRVHITEAAALLGISKDAVRMRIRCGTLGSEKGENGRVYVYLNEVEHAGSIESQDAGGTLSEELRDRVRFLERALETEQGGRRRADTIIAQLSQATAEQARTIRELDAPKPHAEDSQQGQKSTQETAERTG